MGVRLACELLLCFCFEDRGALFLKRGACFKKKTFRKSRSESHRESRDNFQRILNALRCH